MDYHQTAIRDLAAAGTSSVDDKNLGPLYAQMAIAGALLSIDEKLEKFGTLLERAVTPQLVLDDNGEKNKHLLRAESLLSWLEDQNFPTDVDTNNAHQLTAAMALAHAVLANQPNHTGDSDE